MINIIIIDIIQESGRCTQPPDDLKPPSIFDKNDHCKKLYGDVYAYDSKSLTCRVPRCNVKNDKCPKPSVCWRGKVSRQSF